MNDSKQDNAIVSPLEKKLQIKKAIEKKIKKNIDNMLPPVVDLTFDNFSEINKHRCISEFHDLEDWELSGYGNAIAGEIGEACNYIKKLERGEDVALLDIGKELADVVMYVDLLASRLGFSLGTLVKLKFNEVSDRVKSDIKITQE